MAAADGHIVDEVIAGLESRMGSARLPEDRRHELRMMQEREQNRDALLDSIDEAGAALARRAGMLLVAADDDHDERELKVLRRIQAKAGLDDDAMDHLFDWVTRRWRLEAEAGRSSASRCG